MLLTSLTITVPQLIASLGLTLTGIVGSYVRVMQRITQLETKVVDLENDLTENRQDYKYVKDKIDILAGHMSELKALMGAHNQHIKTMLDMYQTKFNQYDSMFLKK